MEVVKTAAPHKAAGKALSLFFSINAQQSILFLISGGSALRVLEHIDFPESAIVTIGVVDERYSETDTERNWPSIQKAPAIQRLLNSTPHAIVPQVVKCLEGKESSEDWEAQLRSWRLTYPEGKVVALLGIGSDGHTAGIFPQMETDTTKWTQYYEVPALVNPITRRLTITPTYLKEQVDKAFVFVAGEEKYPVVRQLLNREAGYETLPASILLEIACTLFTDYDH